MGIWCGWLVEGLDEAAWGDIGDEVGREISRVGRGQAQELIWLDHSTRQPSTSSWSGGRGELSSCGGTRTAARRSARRTR